MAGRDATFHGRASVSGRDTLSSRARFCLVSEDAPGQRPLDPRGLLLYAFPINVEKKRRVLNLIAFFVLLLGLCTAVIVYERAANAPTQVLGYEQGEDGTMYPIMPQDSKKYQRDLKLYGGTANVLADQMRRFIAGLFQGPALGITIGCLSVLAALVLFAAAIMI